jgi:hypothetical protein
MDAWRVDREILAATGTMLLNQNGDTAAAQKE